MPLPLIPTAPPVVVASPPPVMVVNYARAPQRTLAFDVVVRRGDVLLWQGRLTMSSGATAGFTQRIDTSVACTSGSRTGSVSSSNNIQLTLSPSFFADAEPSVRVTARFGRPADQDGGECGKVDRSAEVQAVVQVKPDKPVVLSADGGYSVTLVQRQG